MIQLTLLKVLLTCLNVIQSQLESTQSHRDRVPTNTQPENENNSSSWQVANIGHHMNTRSKVESSNLKYTSLTVKLKNQLQQATQSEKWIRAMNEEYNALFRNKT